MRTIKRDFVCEKHPEYGYGLRPLFIADGDAYSATSAAHDCLEHLGNVHKSIPLCESELMAKGAALWVRRDLSSINGVESIFGDAPEVLRHCRERRIIQRAEACLSKDFEFKLRDMAKYGFELALQSNYPMTDDDWLNIESWMRAGFKNAVEFYGEVDTGKLFNKIVEKADRKIQERCEGEVYRVQFDPSSGFANVIHLIR